MFSICNEKTAVVSSSFYCPDCERSGESDQCECANKAHCT